MQKIGIHFIYILFLSFITLGCHTEGKHTHEDVTTLEEEAHSNAQHTESHTDIISVTREQFEASGFKTGSLEMKPFNTTLITNGRIHLPEKNQAIASSLIGGTVNDIDLIHGQWIKRGQRLMTISNPSLLDFQLEYLELQGKMAFLESEATRLKQLSEENITAEKNYLKAASEFKVAQSHEAAISSKLELFGINPKEVTNTNLLTQLAITAPISGYITDIAVLKGGFLPATAPAVEISNTNHLHAEFKVLEREIPILKKEQHISFTIQGRPGKKLTASIHQIENKIDENRMINLHCHIESDEGIRLIPGMSIRGEIDVELAEDYALPSEAILFNEGKNYALRQIENQALQYEAKEITIGKEENGFTQILNAAIFSDKTIFLTKGAYLVFAPEEEGVISGHSH